MPYVPCVATRGVRNVAKVRPGTRINFERVPVEYLQTRGRMHGRVVNYDGSSRLLPS